MAMITKQQIRVNYLKQISYKSGAKEIKYYQLSKKLLEHFGNSLAMIRTQQIVINYIETINIKGYENKIKHHISRKLY